MSGKRFLRTGERTWVDIGSITHVVGTHAAAGEPVLRVYLAGGHHVEASGYYYRAAVGILLDAMTVEPADLATSPEAEHTEAPF